MIFTFLNITTLKRFQKIFGFLFFLVCVTSHAQTAGINYQAFILNQDEIQVLGKNIPKNTIPLTSEKVKFRFSITNDSNTDLYIEEQSVVTDQNGLVSLIVGQGVPDFSSFKNIVWDGTPKYLNVEIDIVKMNNGYDLLDSQEILYLPSAGTSTSQATNGLHKDKSTIKLGGELTAPTTITTSAINTLSIKGLKDASLNNGDNKVVVIDKNTGVLKKTSSNFLRQQIEKIEIANDDDTTFTTPLPISNDKNINVYRNGIKISFTKLNSSTIKLEDGVVCYKNDEIRIVQYY